MGTVAIIICSHLASQIGCVAQWRQSHKSTPCDERRLVAESGQMAPFYV